MTRAVNLAGRTEILCDNGYSRREDKNAQALNAPENNDPTETFNVYSKSPLLPQDMTRNSTKSLPECNGPKLQPFEDPKATIDIKNLISDANPTDSSSGGHAHVFEALIQGKTYALKIVRQ